MPDVTWIDHHCHLPVEGAAEVVEEALAAGVATLIDVGTSVDTSLLAIERASRHPAVRATAGVHPHDASDGLVGLEALLSDDCVVAVGECGLDYHYLHSPAAVQREVFATQIEMAHRHDLPLVIHSREAWDDTFAILDECGVPEHTVFHCFTGGADEARMCLDRGAMLSFSGIVSFPSAEALREAARSCPMDRMLVETDSPYLAPVPHRGRPNRPALVAAVGAAVADTIGVTPAVVAARTTANATVFYRLAPRGDR